MNLTEAINLAKQGRSIGWGTIIKSTYSRKKFLTSKYLDSSLLDTVLHNAYVKALTSIELLHNPEIFSSWLGIIIASISAIELPKQSNINFSEHEAYENETWYIDIRNEGTPFVSDGLNFSENEIMEFSNKIINSISILPRMCFIYHYAEGFSVKEIARAMRCSENDVISLLNTGVKELNAVYGTLKRNNAKLAHFSNALQLFTFILDAEYDYNRTSKVADKVFNKIIEDTAAIVAEKAINAEDAEEEEAEKAETAGKTEKAVKTEETTETETENKSAGSKKPLIIIAVIVVAIIAGVAIHIANKKPPTQPVDNTAKTTQTSTTTRPSSTTQPTTEGTTEANTEESSSDTNNPVTPQTPNTPPNTPNNPPQNNNNNNHNNNNH
ncbi:MAG: hypothetical protein K2I73_05370, partial [Eubacterium sp.]|nr:hypothetical protein [Eubacterium sp.]